MVHELLATAKKCADADDALKVINEDKRPHCPDHPPRREDNHDGRARYDDRGRNNNRDRCDHRGNRDQRRNNFHGDNRGKHVRDDDDEVNAVKRYASPSG